MSTKEENKEDETGEAQEDSHVVAMIAKEEILLPPCIVMITGINHRSPPVLPIYGPCMCILPSHR